MILGRTFLRWWMYLRHFLMSTVSQNRRILSTSSSLVEDFTSRCTNSWTVAQKWESITDYEKQGIMCLHATISTHMYNIQFVDGVIQRRASALLHVKILFTCTFNSCHRFFIGFASGLSAGVFHQIMLCSVKKCWACLDVCFGSLSCMNR